MTTLLQILIAAGTGGAIVLTLAGYNFFWLAWVVLVPFWVLIRRVTLKRALILALVTAMTEAAFVWYWVPLSIVYMTKRFALAAGIWTILAVYWSFAFCLMVFLVRVVWRLIERQGPARWAGAAELVVAPLAWVVFEYLHTELISHLSLIFFPILAYSQCVRPEMVQPAAYAGVYGVSFAIVLCNAALARAVAERKAGPALLAVLVFVFCFGFGFARIRMADSSTGGRRIRVAILQGHIRAYEKFDRAKSNLIAERYIGLCREAVETKPDLVVWSETAVPWTLEEDDDLAEEALRITAPAQACHILGAPFHPPGTGAVYHNTAFLVLPDGRVTSQYDKRRMLAFVEVGIRLPGSDQPRKLHPTAPSYTGGRRMSILTAPLGKIGVNLCNENFYADMNREVVWKGAELIAHLANDIWFETDMPLREHFWVNVFRAVEAGRDVIVGNNAGISGIVDAHGRVRLAGAMRIPLCLSGEVETRGGMTFYVRHGDLFVFVCMGILVLLVLACLPAGTNPEGADSRPKSRSGRRKSSE